jgi:hypothetical protein
MARCRWFVPETVGQTAAHLEVGPKLRSGTLAPYQEREVGFRLLIRRGLALGRKTPKTADLTAAPDSWRYIPAPANAPVCGKQPIPSPRPNRDRSAPFGRQQR